MKSKLFGLMVLLCIVIVGQTLGAESRGKVLMILRTDYPQEPWLTKEALVMKTMLNESGFDVIIASVAGKLIKGSKASLQPDLKLDEVQTSDYIGVIVPCMGSNDPPIQKAVEIVGQAWQQGKPLAAQLGGVFTLGAAGVLKGKRFTCQPEDAQGKLTRDLIPDGIYAGIGVVVDGNVATSGTCPYMAQYLNKPDGTADLTKEFIALLQ